MTWRMDPKDSILVRFYRLLLFDCWKATAMFNSIGLMSTMKTVLAWTSPGLGRGPGHPGRWEQAGGVASLTGSESRLAAVPVVRCGRGPSLVSRSTEIDKDALHSYIGGGCIIDRAA